MTNEEVKKLYHELFNSKEALSEDEFLDKLIKIENITKYNIFRNLLSYTEKNEIKELIKLYGEQIVKSKSVLRNKLERQSLNNLIGENITIGDILDKYIQRIKTVFSQKTSLDDKLSSLKITYDYIDGVIFPPEGDTRIIPGSGKGLIVKEGYDRVGLLFNDILNVKNNIYLGDFRVVIGKDDKNSLRESSYVVIEIPKLNKTIFVNNKYGEATYIYNGIPTDEDLLTKGKESLRNECTRISFHNINQREKQVLESLFRDNSSKDEPTFKNIKAKDLKNALDMEEEKKRIRTILTNEKNKKEWFALNTVQRAKFKLNDGTSYTIIARIFGINVNLNPKDICKDKVFIELNKIIFGEDDSDVINFINNHVEHTIDSIKDIFRNDEQLKKQRFSMDIRKRVYFKLNGTSYITIAKIFGFKGDRNTLLKLKTFIELSKKIFGENDPDVIDLVNNNVFHTVDSIKTLFSNNEQLKQYRFTLGYTERRDFKLNDGTTYTNIAKIFGLTGEREYLQKHEIFIELSKKIFGENDPDVVDLTKKYIFHTLDSIRNIFLNDEKLKEKRFSTNAHKRTRFKLEDGTTYVDIARILGFKEHWRDLVKDKMFIEVSKKIFGESDSDILDYINRNIEHNADSIRAIFENNEQLKRQRFSLNIVGRIKFKLRDGTSYTNIARIFGIDEKKQHPFKMGTFIELSKKIFGENDPDVIDLVNNNVEHNTDSIIDIFKSDKQLKKEWFTLNSYAQRAKFKLSDGTSYLNIARVFRFNEAGKDVFKDKTFIELSKKIFGEDDPNIINFINSRVKHTIDSIKSMFLNSDKLKKERFSLDYNQRRDFKLSDGTSYVVIARIFGFKEKREDLQKEKPFIELSKRIFGEDDPDVINLANNYVMHEVDTIKNIFANNEQLKKYWFSLKVQERPSFKLSDGTSYINIARNFGFKEDRKYMVKHSLFIELSKKIFGESDSDVVNFANSHIEHTIDSIRNLFDNDKQQREERFSLTSVKRVKYKLKDGTGYVVIARIFGFKENEHDLLKDKRFLELSKRIFGEDDSDVIQLDKRINK